MCRDALLTHAHTYIHTCTYVEVRQNAKPPRYTDMASAHTTYIHRRGLCMFICSLHCAVEPWRSSTSAETRQPTAGP